MSSTSGLYRELGVRPVINALGHPTTIGGNTPSESVREAMEEATTDYVEMVDLLACHTAPCGRDVVQVGVTHFRERDLIDRMQVVVTARHEPR